MATPTTDNRPYCARHEQYYSALAPCTGCDDDPAPAPAIELEPDADPRLLEIECEFRRGADELTRLADDWFALRETEKHKDSIGFRTGIQAYAEAGKLRAREAELVEKRVQRQYGRELMAHEQMMAGLRKAH